MDSVLTGGEQKGNAPKRDWGIFWASVFFVLGFSTVFSIVGVLLQTVLENVSSTVAEWLARIGGAVIILFGLFIMGILRLSFLEREHTVAVRKRFGSNLITSFVFGAAFAVGWTPCVSAALGAILALAATLPGSAFFLLLSYTLGIGIPFIIVGLFSTQAQAFVSKAGKWLIYFQYIFGALLVLMGILIFTSQLSRVANFSLIVDLLGRFDAVTGAGGGLNSFSFLNAGIAFLAGLGSFLSPCILPLVPGFLTYLASTATRTNAANVKS